MDSATPHDVIFSCSLCQATISEIYAETESSEGLQDSTGSTGPIVTKLWLAECAHLTCSKHLEGGGMLEALRDDYNQIDLYTGVPFYRSGCHPRAVCPVCARTKDDHSEKRLYGIRGTHAGEYDVGIPNNWFEIPSIELDANSPGMEALRARPQAIFRIVTHADRPQFQYLALLNYGRSMHGRQTKTNGEAKSLAAENDLLQEERRHLKREVSRLEHIEEDMKKWEARKPAIEHYLSRFTALANENKELRAELRSLGYHIPHLTYAYDGQDASPKQNARTNVEHHAPRNDFPSHLQRDSPHDRGSELENDLRKVSDSTSSSKTMGHEQQRILNPTDYHDSHPLPFTRKRKASEDPEPRGPSADTAEIKRLRMDSRQMMPPPRSETSSNRHQRIRRDSPTKLAKSPRRFEENSENPDLLVFAGDRWENVQEHQGLDRSQPPPDLTRSTKNPSHSEVDVTLSALKSWPLGDISPERNLASRRSVRAPFKSPLKLDGNKSSPPSRLVSNRRLVSSHFQDSNHRSAERSMSRSSLPRMNYERRYNNDGTTTLYTTPSSIRSLREHFEYQPHEAPPKNYMLSRNNGSRDIYVDSRPNFRRSDHPQVLTGKRQHLVASPFFDRVEQSRTNASNNRPSSRAVESIRQPNFGSPVRAHGSDRVPSINALSFIDEPHSNSYEPLVVDGYHYPDLGEVRRADGLFQRPPLLRSSHPVHPAESRSSHKRERTAVLPSSNPSVSNTFRYSQTPRRHDVSSDFSAIKGARTSASRAEPARVNLFGGPGGVFASGGRRAVQR